MSNIVLSGVTYILDLITLLCEIAFDALLMYFIMYFMEAVNE